MIISTLLLKYLYTQFCLYCFRNSQQHVLYPIEINSHILVLHVFVEDANFQMIIEIKNWVSQVLRKSNSFERSVWILNESDKCFAYANILLKRNNHWQFRLPTRVSLSRWGKKFYTVSYETPAVD